MDLNARLNSIMKKDKKTNPKYLCDLIKSDFFYLISSYFEVDFNDIEVDIEPRESLYTICISCAGERMKLMQSLPD